MKYVTVIGNGESRKSFDLYQLEWLGSTIGTNAVHRDFHPDQLVCCDRRMVQEAVNNSYENPATASRPDATNLKILFTILTAKCPLPGSLFAISIFNPFFRRFHQLDRNQVLLEQS